MRGTPNSNDSSFPDAQARQACDASLRTQEEAQKQCDQACPSTVQRNFFLSCHQFPRSRSKFSRLPRLPAQPPARRAPLQPVLLLARMLGDNVHVTLRGARPRSHTPQSHQAGPHSVLEEASSDLRLSISMARRALTAALLPPTPCVCQTATQAKSRPGCA